MFTRTGSTADFYLDLRTEHPQRNTEAGKQRRSERISPPYCRHFQHANGPADLQKMVYNKKKRYIQKLYTHLPSVLPPQWRGLPGPHASGHWSLSMTCTHCSQLEASSLEVQGPARGPGKPQHAGGRRGVYRFLFFRIVVEIRCAKCTTNPTYVNLALLGKGMGAGETSMASSPVNDK